MENMYAVICKNNCSSKILAKVKFDNIDDAKDFMIERAWDKYEVYCHGVGTNNVCFNVSEDKTHAELHYLDFTFTWDVINC